MKTQRQTPLALLIQQQSNKSRWQTGKKSAAFFGFMMKTPLRYPGGKSRAVKHILPHIPEDIDRLCSPFFGGGSVELAVASRGTEVRGYDKMKQLVWFWSAWRVTQGNNMFFFHNWRRRDPPGALRGGDFHSGFIVIAKCLVFILVLSKICNDKTKGVGTLPVYIRRSYVLKHVV